MIILGIILICLGIALFCFGSIFFGGLALSVLIPLMIIWYLAKVLCNRFFDKET